MEITDIAAIPLSHDLEPGRAFGGSRGMTDTRSTTLVRLEADDVPFGIFSGVSDNDRRWYSIENARETIGYDPQDNAEEWDAPPE